MQIRVSKHEKIYAIKQMQKVDGIHFAHRHSNIKLRIETTTPHVQMLPGTHTKPEHNNAFLTKETTTSI